MIRVLRVDGRLVCCEVDFGAAAFRDMPDIELLERINRARGIPNPYIGRQLFGRFVREGLQTVDIFPATTMMYGPSLPDSATVQLESDLTTALAAAVITAAEADEYRRAWVERVDAGEAFAAGSMFIARGTKPQQ